MSRNISSLLVWILFGLVGFVLLCFCFLLFTPAIRPMIMPDYHDYNLDYYQKQFKFNHLEFSRFDEATKIEIVFPRKLPDRDSIILENPAKVEASKQFVQNSLDGWARWNDYKGIVRDETIAIRFYDHNGNYLETYRVGSNRLIYDPYWKYVEDEELLPLLKELEIEEVYLDLKVN